MHTKVNEIIQNMSQVIIGMETPILKVILTLLSNGHVLIEDVPGIGKTQLVLALSRSVSGQFQRVQMTPDIMPSDILGFHMINKNNEKFVYRAGAAMCNFLLADEINRASAKSQSSLLEVMEEHQISLEGNVYQLPDPFIVFATQNPIENYGTYHLPEAQMDRFLMRISIGYPTPEHEMDILENNRDRRDAKDLSPVLTTEDMIQLQEQVEQIEVNDAVKKYIIDLVSYTRSSEDLKLGISPQGSIALFKIAKAMAFVQERNYVTPVDVASLAPDVLSHRIILSQEGKAKYRDTQSFITEMLKQVAVESNE